MRQGLPIIIKLHNLRRESGASRATSKELPLPLLEEPSPILVDTEPDLVTIMEASNDR